MTRATWLLAAVLCGCPLVPVSPDGGACPEELGVGTGTSYDGFQPLADGDELEIIAGFQGGQHVWVSAKTTGLPRVGELSWGLKVGGQTVTESLVVPINADSANLRTCGWERSGDRLVFRLDGEQFRGQQGTLQVSWTSLSADPVYAQRTLTLK